MSVVSSVNVAFLRTGEWTGRVGKTGIDKRSVDGPVRFTEAGVDGDSVCDTDHHGAWYQAAYAFDSEELAFWSAELGKDLVPGNAGENLTLSGVDSSAALIGERWEIGGAVFRVTGSRQPCRVFAGFWDVPGLVKKFTAHGRTGAYLAVERPGEISAGEQLRVLSRPEHGVRVDELFALLMHNREDRAELAEHVAGCLPDLPGPWREYVADKIDTFRSAARA
ncbi:MOSC domain-containing protein [Saccharopolyspora dendranthemae]|uniref:MOSC domain-containing protein YiiM n=1 Tax=Saccharopolyspora dendranthemae TaxID=1181886 RepID=A0A561U2Y1_9PSEU|nr:MOSC domain-containing protein [Saccharopolyspora dendranthemae]TWF93719.1 MOSC domain-containing protein YiiM [Saccharopolyspora dendranthemae]